MDRSTNSPASDEKGQPKDGLSKRKRYPCTHPGAPKDDLGRCRECVRDRSQRYRDRHPNRIRETADKWRNGKTAAGLCLWCGQRPTGPGRKMCARCLEVTALKQRIKRAGARAAKYVEKLADLSFQLQDLLHRP